MTSAIRWRVFALAAVTVNLIAFLMVRLAPKAAVGIGAAVDVAVTVPVLYFLLIVRAGVQPLVSVVPLCLLGLLRATYLAPGIAGVRPAVGAAVELALAALIVGRVRRATHAQSGNDILERLQAAAREIVPSQRLAAVLASEMAIFYYAFGAWRRPVDAPAGTSAFSIHRESGVADLFGVLAGISLMEATLVHLVVVRWNAAAAWTLTVLSIYGAVWLVAMARAFVLRPVLVDGAELVVRSGMMWTLRVPLSEIAKVESGGLTSHLRVPPASQPNVTVRLSNPVTAHGMYGMKRQVTSIAMAVDNREAFLRVLTHGN